MWLVLTAMRRPITIVVAVCSIVLASVIAMQRMKVDIFPQLGAPAIYVAQPYGGMDPSQMEGYLTYYYEYHFLYITGKVVLVVIGDRKSTRLNSSHRTISYAVFCLKKKNQQDTTP